MSRSNPTNNQPNPSTRWFNWNGELGCFRYYDKDKEANVNLDKPNDFTFILLDEMNSCRGWHDREKCGIISNAVRDTRTEPLHVRTFNGTQIATGLWADIRDEVGGVGGQFSRDCYVAFKADKKSLAIGSVQLKGAALGAWFEFIKANRKRVAGPNGQPMQAYYANAIRVRKHTKQKVGKIEFFVPVFELAPLSKATNDQATALDIELQEYLTAYLARSHSAIPTGEEAQPDTAADEPQPDPEDNREPDPEPGDDVPF